MSSTVVEGSRNIRTFTRVIRWPIQYERLINIYQEKTAGTKNAFTGNPNPGYATYIPVSTTIGKSPKDSGLEEGYPLYLITQRDVTMTKSRTSR